MNERTENYIVEDGTLVWINPELKEFTIPEGVVRVKAIENYDGGSKLEKIVFSSTVKEVIDHCFYSFCYLKSVILNDGLERLESNCFLYTSIKEFILPSTVKQVGEDALFDSGIEKLVIKGADTQLPNYSSFGGRDNLKELSFPASFNNGKFLDRVFSNCYNIDTINFDVEDGNNIGYFNMNLSNSTQINFTFDNSRSIVDMIQSGNLFKLMDKLNENKTKTDNKLTISFRPNADAKKEDEDGWYEALNKISDKCDNSYVLFSLIIRRALEVTNQKVDMIKKNNYPHNDNYENDILKYVIWEIAEKISDKEYVSDVISNIYLFYPKYSEKIKTKEEEIEKLLKMYNNAKMVMCSLNTDAGEAFNKLFNTLCENFIDRLLFTDKESSKVFHEFFDDLIPRVSELIKISYTTMVENECSAIKKNIREKTFGGKQK